MFQNYAEMEAAVSNLAVHIQTHFSDSWLLHPGSDRLPVTNITPPRSNLTHRSQLFEFCCVLDGNVLLQVEQNILHLAKGQVFLLPAGTLHAELTGHDCVGTICWFVCFSDRVWVNISATDEAGNSHLLHGQRVPIEPITVTLLLKDIITELGSDQYGAAALTKCLVLQTLLTLIRQLQAAEHKLTTQQWRESVVKEVLAHLRNNPGGTLDMNDLADRCAMSVNHLNSIFKAITGKTVYAYCSDLRIEQAKQLLVSSPIKLRELSEQLGYYDQYHFCKAFKKATGKSPSAYRAEKNGKDFT